MNTLTERLTNEQIGKTLKYILENKELTMKQLSNCSNLDIATISRIVNGKRVASIQHLEVITACLDMTLVEFLELTNKQTIKSDGMVSDDLLLRSTIESVIQEEQIDPQVLTEQVLQNELHKYEQYANTKEGQRIIHQQFDQKLRDIDGNGHFISKLKTLFSFYTKEDTSVENRLYIGAALLYVITPIDLIPDMLFPIGYLDDLLIVQLVSNKVFKA